VVLVFIDQLVEIFIDIGILLVVEEVEAFTEYGADVVDDIEEELDETFFPQESDSDRTLRAPTED
jgi:hypothetical protein